MWHIGHSLTADLNPANRINSHMKRGQRWLARQLGAIAHGPLFDAVAFSSSRTQAVCSRKGLHQPATSHALPTGSLRILVQVVQVKYS